MKVREIAANIGLSKACVSTKGVILGGSMTCVNKPNLPLLSLPAPRRSHDVNNGPDSMAPG